MACRPTTTLAIAVTMVAIVAAAIVGVEGAVQIYLPAGAGSDGQFESGSWPDVSTYNNHAVVTGGAGFNFINGDLGCATSGFGGAFFSGDGTHLSIPSNTVGAGGYSAGLSTQYFVMTFMPQYPLPATRMVRFENWSLGYLCQRLDLLCDFVVVFFLFVCFHADFAWN